MTMIRRGKYLVTWAGDGQTLVRVRRRWFPWPKQNVVFWRTIYEGRPYGMNAPTFLHDLAHVWQYLQRGWWWVLTKPGPREREARQWKTGDPKATWVQVQ